MPGQLDVVIGVLAAFFRVDASFFARDGDTETQAGDEVHEEEDEGADGEAPEGGGTDSAELVAHLFPVAFDPANGGVCVAV